VVDQFAIRGAYAPKDVSVRNNTAKVTRYRLTSHNVSKMFDQGNSHQSATTNNASYLDKEDLKPIRNKPDECSCHVTKTPELSTTPGRHDVSNEGFNS
jgi:hypothetical protein